MEVLVFIILILWLGYGTGIVTSFAVFLIWPDWFGRTAAELFPPLPEESLDIPPNGTFRSET